jgi:hypothetical protein
MPDFPVWESKQNKMGGEGEENPLNVKMSKEKEKGSEKNPKEIQKKKGKRKNIRRLTWGMTICPREKPRTKKTNLSAVWDAQKLNPNW